jgi:hypothetical protein
MNIFNLIFIFYALTFSVSIAGEEHKTISPSQSSINDHKIIHRFLLITGCGRSGTLYITDLLSKCSDLKIGHEKLGKDGICSWYLAVDSENPPRGPLAKHLDFSHTFHQVRDPRKMIASCMLTFKTRTWKFIQESIPEINLEDSIAVRSAKYWYYWNKKAEAKAEWTYRLEDIKTLLGEFEERLGIMIDRNAVEAISASTNTRGQTECLTWHQLKEMLPAELYNNIVDLAIHYGYEGVDHD